jgi:RecA-family ATPase
VGKTNLKIVEALSLVTGRDLLACGHSRPPICVWLWNLEDPRDEMVRRIQAAAKHYGITEADIGGRLFLDIGREQELVIGHATKTGTVIRKPVVDSMVAGLQANRIDVLIIDPFVSSHRVGENDNNAIDAVAKQWARVAGLANCAIDLVHHTRKQGSVEPEVTVESARGGKALTDACRSVVVFNRMTENEGEKAGVTNHRSYFRVFADKGNMSPPAEVSDCIGSKASISAMATALESSVSRTIMSAS